MFYIIKQAFSANWIVFLPILSAAASFILSFWLKIILEPNDYGNFATAFFTVNVLIGLGVLGYDQVIIKLSRLNDGNLEIDNKIFVLGFILLLCTPWLSFTFLNIFGVMHDFDLGFVLLSWVSAALAMLVIVFNLQGRLLESYIFSGGWKFFLLCYVFVFYMANLPFLDYEYFILISLVSVFIWFIFCRDKIFCLAGRELPLKKIFLLYISSLVSLLSYHMFDGLDRFLLISNFDKVVFGDYFFVSNFLLSPSSIFISYFVAKKMKIYKERFVFSDLLSDYLKVTFFSLIMTTLFCLILLAAREAEVVEFSNVTVIGFWAIGFLTFLKSCYTLLSSAYRIVASNLTLVFGALLFSLISISVFFFFENIGIDNNVTNIVLFMIFLWVIRSIFYFIVIYRDSRFLKRINQNSL